MFFFELVLQYDIAKAATLALRKRYGTEYRYGDIANTICTSKSNIFTIILRKIIAFLK